MKTKQTNAIWRGFGALALASLIVFFGLRGLEQSSTPAQAPGAMPRLEANQRLVTLNTTRIGSDDPVETAVAVAQIIYPATEEENIPGAVVLVNQDNLAEVMVAASRFQHFPVNAPLLYVNADSLPTLTRDELLRLTPEGVLMDGNVQVYLVGGIDDSVVQEVQALGFKTRVVRASDPVELAVLADDWSSTQHGDHRNEVVIASLDQPELAIPSIYWNAHMGQGFGFVTRAGVPAATADMLRRRANGPWLYVFGDETVISEVIAAELTQYGQVTRMPRADLPGISAYFAGFKDTGADWGAWFWQASRDFGWGLSEAGHNAIFVNIAGPGGWQNAVVATTLSHMGKHAPVLFVEQDAVPQAVADYLRVIAPYPTAPRQQLLNHGWIIGGEATISWETQVAIDGMLEAYRPQTIVEEEAR